MTGTNVAPAAVQNLRKARRAVQGDLAPLKRQANRACRHAWNRALRESDWTDGDVDPTPSKIPALTAWDVY